MWKSNSKKGFFMIETIISLSIISIVLVYLFSIGIYSVRRNRDIEDREYYMHIFEAFKNELIYNHSYAELQCYSDKELFISEEYLGMDKLKESDVFQMIKEEKIEKYPYMSIRIYKSGNILKINITMKTEKEELNRIYSKGNY